MASISRCQRKLHFRDFEKQFSMLPGSRSNSSRYRARKAIIRATAPTEVRACSDNHPRPAIRHRWPRTDSRRSKVQQGRLCSARKMLLNKEDSALQGRFILLYQVTPAARRLPMAWLLPTRKSPGATTNTITEFLIFNNNDSYRLLLLQY